MPRYWYDYCFVELGQDVHIEGGNLNDAINAGVAKGYTEGYLRKSVVAEPLSIVKILKIIHQLLSTQKSFLAIN